MQLKKDLVLRKVAGEYIVVPIGRLSKISPMMQVTSSTAWLWDVMKEGEFTEDSLVEAVLGHFSGVDEARAREDVHKFLELLDGNYMLENGRPEPIMGTAEITLTPEQAKRLDKGREE